MPSINFPTSPALNDEYSFEGKTWRYNGTAWTLISSPTTLRLDAAFSKANVANTLAQAAFDTANSASAGSIDVYARTHANAAFDKANTGATPVSGIFDYGLVTDITTYTSYDYGTL